MSRSVWLVCVVVGMAWARVEVRSKTLPSFLEPYLCRKSDPMLSACVNKSIESLRPLFVKGMPELNFATLEPVRLPEITLIFNPKDVGAKDSTNVKAIAKDIRCTGASRFKLHKLRLDLKLLIFHVDLELPSLSCDAEYDVDVRLANIPIKGHGPIAGNASNIRITALFLGELYTTKGVRHLRLNKVDVHLANIGNPAIKIGNVYKGNTLLTDAFSALVNANSKMFIEAITPNFESSAAAIILETTNEANKKIDFDEVFPN